MSLVEEVLAAWGTPVVIGPLSGGNRNTVLEIHLDGRRLAARRSARPAASLDWEATLLEYLAGQGQRVPVPVPALDGRRHVDGVMVQTWLPGREPRPGDWPAVAAALSRIHQLTAGWPQRPGFAATTELLIAERGGDVDLPTMPAGAVAACRAAWAGLRGSAQAVIHGDPGPANVRITSDGAGLLDWDEARVDSTDLDLAELPGHYLPPGRLALARAAATAWEAARGWTTEPSYARRQLALRQAGRDSLGS